MERLTRLSARALSAVATRAGVVAVGCGYRERLWRTTCGGPAKPQAEAAVAAELLDEPEFEPEDFEPEDEESDDEEPDDVDALDEESLFVEVPPDSVVDFVDSFVDEPFDADLALRAASRLSVR